MKRFLKYSALFLALAAVALGVCEWLVRTAPNSYTLKDRFITAHGDAVRTLILGGSHNYYGIRPSEMGDSCFNLANVSQGPEYDWFLLTKYGDRLTHLRNVVLVVDESNIFDPPFEDDDSEWFRAIFYKIYYRYPKHSDFSKYNLELASMSSFVQKFPKAVKYHLFGKTDDDCDSLGWKITPTAEEFDTVAMRADARKTLERHRCKNWSNVDYNVGYLYKIGDWCKAHGVQLVIITTPMWSEFVKGVPPRQLAVMYRTVKEMQTRHGALYHDYLRDPRFQGTDFNDADHLSLAGATKLSRILKHDFPAL